MALQTVFLYLKPFRQADECDTQPDEQTDRTAVSNSTTNRLKNYQASRVLLYP